MNVPITIYDWQCKYATRKWIYTAATKARQLKQIHFDGGKDTFEERADLVTSYFKKKVDGYMQQDKKAGRIIDPDTYVTVEWLEACCGKPCQNSCGTACGGWKATSPPNASTTTWDTKLTTSCLSACTVTCRWETASNGGLETT